LIKKKIRGEVWVQTREEKNGLSALRWGKGTKGSGPGNQTKGGGEFQSKSADSHLPRVVISKVTRGGGWTSEPKRENSPETLAGEISDGRKKGEKSKIGRGEKGEEAISSAQTGEQKYRERCLKRELWGNSEEGEGSDVGRRGESIRNRLKGQWIADRPRSGVTTLTRRSKRGETGWARGRITNRRSTLQRL